MRNLVSWWYDCLWDNKPERKWSKEALQRSNTPAVAEGGAKSSSLLCFLSFFCWCRLPFWLFSLLSRRVAGNGRHWSSESHRNPLRHRSKEKPFQSMRVWLGAALWECTAFVHVIFVLFFSALCVSWPMGNILLRSELKMCMDDALWFSRWASERENEGWMDGWISVDFPLFCHFCLCFCFFSFILCFTFGRSFVTEMDLRMFVWASSFPMLRLSLNWLSKKVSWERKKVQIERSSVMLLLEQIKAQWWLRDIWQSPLRINADVILPALSCSWLCISCFAICAVSPISHHPPVLWVCFYVCWFSW